MEHYAGIDVSLELSSLCIVDTTGRIIREAKVASEPEALIGWLRGLGLMLVRIGLEAGPLSQWLYAAMREDGLPVELLGRSTASTDTCGMPSRRCRSRPTARMREASPS